MNQISKQQEAEVNLKPFQIIHTIDCTTLRSSVLNRYSAQLPGVAEKDYILCSRITSTTIKYDEYSHQDVLV